MTFDIALTGITAATTELEVISNNIANSATTGFKRSRAEFSDVYAESSSGYSSTAVGQGVSVDNVRQQFTQGDVEFTNNNLDLSVSGQGMFRVTDHGAPLFTRNGTFGLDREGFIVNSAGQKLTGFTADATGNILPLQDELKVDFADLSPKATENVKLSMNLDTNAPVQVPFDKANPNSYNFTTSTTVYDTLGAAHTATIYLHKDTPNSWSAFTYADDQQISQAGGDELTFANDGSLATVNGATNTVLAFAPYTPASGASDINLKFDVSSLTQFNNPFGVNFIEQDGYMAGRLDSFDIDEKGFLYGRYSNGQAKAMGQITLTNFPNAEGLNQVGNSSWGESFASGESATGSPGSASLGLIQSGSLENSNVDITEELVAMIGAQRNFQANAQVISTGDTITQTIINIRR